MPNILSKQSIIYTIVPIMVSYIGAGCKRTVVQPTSTTTLTEPSQTQKEKTSVAIEETTPDDRSSTKKGINPAPTTGINPAPKEEVTAAKKGLDITTKVDKEIDTEIEKTLATKEQELEQELEKALEKEKTMPGSMEGAKSVPGNYPSFYPKPSAPLLSELSDGPPSYSPPKSNNTPLTNLYANPSPDLTNNNQNQNNHLGNKDNPNNNPPTSLYPNLSSEPINSNQNQNNHLGDKDHLKTPSAHQTARSTVTASRLQALRKLKIKIQLWNNNRSTLDRLKEHLQESENKRIKLEQLKIQIDSDKYLAKKCKDASDRFAIEIESKDYTIKFLKKIIEKKGDNTGSDDRSNK